MVDPSGDADDAAALDSAADRLYGSPADGFMALRTELAAEAKRSGRVALAKQITALRKPSAAAALVNRLVLDDAGVTDRLRDLYDRLQRAHSDLDAAQLRELSGERRSAVGELASAALQLDGRDEPSTALRDDVVATLDAAVADPAIAGRLGRLTKPERWSGFGVALPTGSPELTLVRGGKGTSTGRRAGRGTGVQRRAGTPYRTDAAGDEPAADPADEPAGDPGPSSAAERRAARVRDKARTAFEAADGALTTAEETQRGEADRVKSLAARLTDLQRELEQAKLALDKARHEVKSARGRRREARSALDRAERDPTS